MVVLKIESNQSMLGFNIIGRKKSFRWAKLSFAKSQ